MKWAIAVLALGAMAAAGFEIWLAVRQHPRRLVYAWLAWTPLAFLGALAGSWDTASPAASVLLAAAAAPFAYPVVRGFIWMRFESRFQQAEERAADAERMKYRAMDFGGVATIATAAAPLRQAVGRSVESPIAAPTKASRLDRATRERRPPWVGRAEILLIVGVCAVGGALYVGSMITNLDKNRAPSDEEMVAGTLELNGYGGPRVSSTGETCADGRSASYRWSAVGSEGRACVDAHEGQVSLWVERRWPG